MEEQVILVNEQDVPTGTMEKLQAHREGRLHRAVSVFVFNEKGEMLLQKRAAEKYHSANLWSNACCSHPRESESAVACAHRRLREEMGFDCELTFRFPFTYKAALDHGLTEYEYDHVFFGSFSGVPNPDPAEVCGWKYLSMEEITKQLKQNPEDFTTWFRLILQDGKVRQYF